MRSETFSVRAAIVCASFCQIAAAQARAAFPLEEPAVEAVGEEGTGVAPEPQPVLAPPPPPPPGWAPPPPPPRWYPHRDEVTQQAPVETTRWYGWQTLAADGAALLLLGTAVDATSEGPLILSGVTYLFAAPVIHAVHGRSGAAFGSLALRMGAPIAGAAIGASQCNGGEGEELRCIEPVVFGAMAGIAAAIALDAALLARETVTESPLSVSEVRVVPSITPTGGGVSAGLSGVF